MTVNNNLVNKVVMIILSLAVVGSWGFLTSRASNEDVKDNEEQIVENRRLEDGRHEMLGQELTTIKVNQATMKVILERIDRKLPD